MHLLPSILLPHPHCPTAPLAQLPTYSSATLLHQPPAHLLAHPSAHPVTHPYPPNLPPPSPCTLSSPALLPTLILPPPSPPRCPHRYRRLDLWLPHGLSPETPISRLAGQIQLCQVVRPPVSTPPDPSTPCDPVAFSLTLPQPGIARLAAPTLAPRSLYRLSVTASGGVTDGFGLPLEASGASFWATDTTGYFTQLGVPPVALFELPPSPSPAANASGGSSTSGGSGGAVVWPILTAVGSGDQLQSSVPGTGPDVASAAAWAVSLTDDASVGRLVNLLTSTRGIYVPDLLGRPDQEVAVPPGLSPAAGVQRLNLTLDPSRSAVHVVASCCTYQRWTTPVTRNSASVNVVAISHLAAAVIVGPSSVTAWVTDTSETGGAGPVEGATVWLYLAQYSASSGAVLLGRCSTDAGGSCTVPAGSQVGAGERGCVTWGAIAVCCDLLWLVCCDCCVAIVVLRWMCCHLLCLGF